MPNHIAIIPDGNRRWARARGLYTLEGHKAGFDNAVNLMKAARQLGVHTVTLWGFSTENWDRTEEEIGYLMKLYHKLLDDYIKEAHKDKVRIHHLGRKDRLPTSLIKKIADSESQTAHYTKYIANIGLDYGGQDEILRIVKLLIDEGVPPEKINAKLFDKYSDLQGQPYPNVDLMIRTSGEQRTSGFLLWHSAYTEYYWENDHFPDFGPEKLRAAILDFSRRRRRFGGNDAMEHFKFSPSLAAKLEINWWRLRNIPQGTAFTDYAMQHLKEQFGLSKELAHDAATFMTEALVHGSENKWKKALVSLKNFYRLIKEELKLAFEPSLAASLEVKLWKDLSGKTNIREAVDVEETAKELYAEVYRISLFQAAKAAHLRILAAIERNLAERGMGEVHWARAEDYLQKFYSALKERIA